MPVLENAKHELFCQARAQGETADKAYQTAGYKEHRGNAAALSAKKHIKARIAEIQGLGAEKVRITLAEVINELADIALSRPGDLMDVDKDGVPQIDWKRLTKAQRKALRSFSTDSVRIGKGDDAENVQRVTAKFSDPVPALKLLGDHLGAFPSKHEVTGANGGPVEFSVIERVVVEAGGEG